jgi:SAM-dependent methyltransferase
MHPAIFEIFERICRARGAGGDVLEIGATPATDTLLHLPCLAAARSRIGLDLDGPHQCDGFAIVAGQANGMTMFADASFDTVLCNSMLEHDGRFWLTLAEIRRVLRPGGLLVLGIPAYLRDRLSDRLGESWAPRDPGGADCAAVPKWLEAATAVLGVHDYPHDYYRFSAHAVGEVLMEGMVDIELTPAMQPPRLVASGRRAATPAEAAIGQRAEPVPGLWKGIDQLAALARELGPLGPPVIVFNKSHSGSRLLARCLATAGVFMGAERSESEDALPIVPLVEHIVEFHYPDFSRFFREGDPALPGLVKHSVSRHLGLARHGRPPAGAWGWKLCETHYALPIIARLFPTARFIHLLRDGRDVAFSDFVAPTTPFLKKIYFGTDRVEQWRGLPLTEAQYRAAPHLFNARLWVAAVSDARSHGMMLGERYCEVRYESLVGDIARTMRRLARFLSLQVPEATLAELASGVRTDAVGRHRKAPPAHLGQVLMVLGPSLAAFGYGPEAAPEPGDARRLSIVLLAPEGGGDAGCAASLADLGRLSILRPEILLAAPALPPEPAGAPSPPAFRHVALEAGVEEAAAAAAGLAAATSDYVLFVRPGLRFTSDGLERLLRDAEQADALAAVGRLVGGPHGGEISAQIGNQELLRWADAAPVGSVLFRRARLAARLLSAIADDPEGDGATGTGGWWHWALLAAASRDDLVIYAHHVIGRSSASLGIRSVPHLVLDRLATTTLGAAGDPGVLRRIMVYGAGGASSDLLFDGLPEELRRHLRFVPQAERELDLQRLAPASVVLLLRDFQLPLRNGTIDTLTRLEIPFYYVADDHFPTLAREDDALSFYTESNVGAMLALAAGAIVTTTPLREKLAPLAAEVLLWPPVWDATLLPARGDPAIAATADGCLRFGIMGHGTRAGMLQDRILPALRRLAQHRPLELVARSGLIDTTDTSLPCTSLPFEPSFRRFIHAWRRRHIDVILHPPTATANAVYKNPNALLVSRYLGAVPVLAAADPAYRDLPAGCGAIIAGPDRTPWPLALQQVAEPETRKRLARELDLYCRSAFPAAPAIAALRRVLERAAPVSEALIAERRARIAAGMPFLNRVVNPRYVPA